MTVIGLAHNKSCRKGKKESSCFKEFAKCPSIVCGDHIRTRANGSWSGHSAPFSAWVLPKPSCLLSSRRLCSPGTSLRHMPGRFNRKITGILAGGMYIAGAVSLGPYCHKDCNSDLYRKPKINNIQQEHGLCEQIKYLCVSTMQSSVSKWLIPPISQARSFPRAISLPHYACHSPGPSWLLAFIIQA